MLSCLVCGSQTICFSTPMAKSRQQKSTAHDQVVDRLSRMQSVVFAGYAGLTVKDVTDLRSTLRQVGAEMVAVKKTVLKRALESAKLDAAAMEALTGEVAMVFGFEDEVTPAKTLATFAKTHEALVLKGAFVNGAFLDAAGAKALSKLPGRDELRTKVVWLLASPMSGVVNVLAGNVRGLLNVLVARQKVLDGTPA